MSLKKTASVWNLLIKAAAACPEHYEEIAKAYYKQSLELRAPEPLRSTEPVIGWRVWKRVGSRLTSAAYQKHVWPFRKPMVRDEIDNLGIHAMKNSGALKDLLAMYPAEVAGSVWMWGEVKEHTSGYLAEFAYPRSLFMAEDTDPLVVLELEEAYGVPISLRNLVWQSAISKAAYAAAIQNASAMAQAQQLAQLTQPPWIIDPNGNYINVPSPTPSYYTAPTVGIQGAPYTWAGQQAASWQQSFTTQTYTGFIGAGGTTYGT